MQRSLLLFAGCGPNPSLLSLAAFKKAYSWDGLGQDPNRPVRQARPAKPEVLASASEAEIDDDIKLASVKNFSPEWWLIRNSIERRHDAKLTRAIVICRGCGLSAKVEDHTGSIH